MKTKHGLKFSHDDEAEDEFYWNIEQEMDALKACGFTGELEIIL